MIQTAIAGLENDVDEFFLGDGVADLDGAAADAFRIGAQLDGRKSGAVDAVTPGSSSNHYDEIADLWLLVGRHTGNQPDRAAKNQRIGQIAVVKQDSAVDGGDPHAVAVVADAGHHAAHDFSGVEHAGRQR